MSTKDLFSGHAAQYANYRPDYPKALFDFVFKHLSNFDTAWDCATGNGQAAKVLSARFKKVIATDISEKQLANGYRAENIHYSLSPAENTIFNDNTFDLITVAQAAHWFQLDNFYKEAQRVAKHGSLISIWGYGLLSINDEFDAHLKRLYKTTVGPYWDAARKLVDEEYKTLLFPFKEIQSPSFYSIKNWNAVQVQGYLETWSAVQSYIKINGQNPIPNFMEQAAYSLEKASFQVKFPIFLRLGIVEK